MKLLLALAMLGLTGGLGALEVPLYRAPGGQPAIDLQDPQGRSISCIVDSGAMQTVLSPTLVATGSGRFVGQVHATGAGGSLLLPSWQMEGWRLGEQPLPPFAALLMDLGNQTPCVLAWAALGSPRIELDDAGGRLRAAADLPELAVQLPYEAVQGFIRLSLPFPGAPDATLILDTGAGTSVLNRRAGHLLGLDPNRPSNWVDRRGLDGRVRRHRVHGLAGLPLLPGGTPLTRVEIAELPALATLGVRADTPGGLLGADAFRGRRVLIDRQRQRLELDRSDPLP
ncbi:MAG: retroviral-like aspartic protease family protein [Xanthomonadales bacterium]|nr:retroviral-like aspartic protease family protein [Xanthomonadales bacterium]